MIGQWKTMQARSICRLPHQVGELSSNTAELELCADVDALVVQTEVLPCKARSFQFKTLGVSSRSFGEGAETVLNSTTGSLWYVVYVKDLSSTCVLIPVFAFASFLYPDRSRLLTNSTGEIATSIHSVIHSAHTVQDVSGTLRSRIATHRILIQLGTLPIMCTSSPLELHHSLPERTRVRRIVGQVEVTGFRRRLTTFGYSVFQL